MAYNAGLVSAREATALGVNVNFDPCVDILFNWRNTIVNTRAYGTDADTVIRHTSAYIEGLNAEREIVTCIKHFPGDGTEERDQHLVLGVNELTPDEWDDSFGRVYRTHIDNGVEMIMAGHIALPEYQKKLDPSLADADILPATLAPELLQGLLKTQLGLQRRRDHRRQPHARHELGHAPRGLRAGRDRRRLRHVPVLQRHRRGLRVHARGPARGCHHRRADGRRGASRSWA